MGLRDRLRRLQKATERDMLTFKLRGGATARFYEDEVFPEAFIHQMDRGRRHHEGEDPGPAHPFVEALRNAAPGEIERLIPTQGAVLGMLVGEDEVVRGERERPGPPVHETSPGVYE